MEHSVLTGHNLPAIIGRSVLIDSALLKELSHKILCIAHIW